MGWMAFSNSHEYPSTGSTYLLVTSQLSFDHSPVIGRIDDPGSKTQEARDRCWSAQLDGIFGGDRTRWRRSPRPFHQMPGGGPVAVTIEKSADDSTTKNSWESLVIRLSPPQGNAFFTLYEGPDAQPLLVGRPASKALVMRSKRLLEALFLFHGVWMQHIRPGSSRVHSFQQVTFERPHLPCSQRMLVIVPE